jgi:hypothetical protein
MSIFQTNILCIEKENNSVIEDCNILSEVLASLKIGVRINSFHWIFGKYCVKKLKRDMNASKCEAFKEEMTTDNVCIEYLECWTQQVEELKPLFAWMRLKDLVETLEA